ncbi:MULTISPECIES: hypothetical protein [unclassified Paenibacillus]|uniref:hypothetical protein n=1 Tax=unclassified Paenibacillus TaxID=185978 RepID=UPI0024054DCE|nr:MULTISPECIES: hypothetical protein [unclassified Paenibacillus]MDF9844980.1 hypothetical protein [Paenibacillus sp. PastF-2]MDF9851579.1 hypothetical protein [Paenibacillus sp. PastM-2]MDF9858163.1 hypothetical protein [Paenibacillus sp. PastF-1]MDH6483389.1 hypothetical protein [Paenibacillus sp. PastH-2]MDH6510839.1 hypothetical protein [Paenibacillus sp. PastM-3]
MIICSVTCADNLHEAKMMARAVKYHMPYAWVVICLMERTIHPAAVDVPYFDEVVLAKDLGIPHFEGNIFKYSLLEAVTSIKPKFLRTLFDRYPHEQNVVFMDTDIIAYAPFDDLLAALEHHSILLSPHRIEPNPEPLGYLQHGIYNTGFLALRRSEETMRFLEWWGQRLYSYCHYHAPFFVDQKWVDLAAAFFDIQVWKHPGYNVAAWNLHERCRRIVREENGRFWLDNDVPFVCYHYSGMHGMLQYCMAEWLPDKSNPLYRLLQDYVDELEVMGKSELSEEPWSYDYYLDGGPISIMERKAYGSDASAFESGRNPFLRDSGSGDEWM